MEERIVALESNYDNLVSRVIELEKSDAVDKVQVQHFDKRFDSLDKRISSIDGKSDKLYWTVVGGIIAAIVTTLVRAYL